MSARAPYSDLPIASRYQVVADLATIDATRLLRAIDLESHQFVVLALVSADVEDARLIRHAVMIAGAIAHPHVAGLLDAGEHDGLLYQAYTFVPGRFLSDVLRDDVPLTAEDALHHLLEIVRGLRALHEAGLVHGSLSPRNIVLGWDGEIRLTGYVGSGRRSKFADLDVSRPDLESRYLAPEQVEGRLATPAADIFAAGMLLAQLVDETAVSSSVQSLIERACADEPGRRFASARQFEAAVSDALASLRVREMPAASAPFRDDPPQAAPEAVLAPLLQADPALATEDVHVPVFDTPPIPVLERQRSDLFVSGLLAVAVVLLIGIVVTYIVASSMLDGSPPSAVAGVSEDGEGSDASAAIIPTMEPEVVDDPAAQRERDLMVARAVLSGPARTVTAGAQPAVAAAAPTVAAPTAVPTVVATATAVPTTVAIGSSGSDVVIAFELVDWRGGWSRTDTGFLGRPWISLYGARSGFGEAEISFTLDEPAADSAILRLVGVDDQSGEESRIEIWVNGKRVFAGPSPFPKWDGESDEAPWTSRDFLIPVSALKAGENTIKVANANPSPNFGQPPFILISHASLTIQPD